MIPKRIFYVWGYKEPKKRDVLACMLSWRQNCPGYEIIEINENSTQYFDFQGELKRNKWFAAVYKRKMWAYVADYIRVHVLYGYGGIYLDTDVSVIKNFDEFLHDPAFVGMQDNAAEGKHDFVEPAILGAEKNNQFLKQLVDFYEEDVWKLPIYAMPDLFAWALKRMYGNAVKHFPARAEQKVIKYDEMHIYPEKVFIPFRFSETFSPECITEQTHTVHWWSGSWLRPEVMYFLNNKHLGKAIASDGYLRTVYILFVPIKIFITDDAVKIANFTIFSKKVFSKISNAEYTDVYELKLFGKFPFFKISQKGTRKKYYVFNTLIGRVLD